MEWFFDNNLDFDQSHVNISGEEFKHIKAHRIKINDKIIVTNGKGLACECLVRKISKNDCITDVLSRFEQDNSINRRITLAMPLLDSKERFEFALEKAIELGATNFIPILTRYSSKKQISQQRLVSKAISAIKQCQRATLPLISSAIQLEDLLSSVQDNQMIVVADIKGQKPELPANTQDIVLIVGPEGGLSEQELTELSSRKNCKFWNLGKSRLRAETSAIILLGLVMNLAP